MSQDLASEVESALHSRQVKRRGDEYDFLCVSHDETVPSAGWNRKKDSWHCMKCGDGGSTRDLAEKLGIRVEQREQARYVDVTAYDYRDAQGVLQYQVVRQLDQVSGKKRFLQRHKGENGEWVWKKRAHIPYRIPDLVAVSGRIYIPEGEKDVDNLIKEGARATTLPEGATDRTRDGVPGRQKWDVAKFRPYVQGCDVVLLADNDQPGTDLMQHVAAGLHGCARSIKVLVLPVGPKGDVSDWLFEGGTLEALDNLADDAPEWSPRLEAAREGIAAYPETDAGNAELFAHMHGGTVRYDWARDRWLVWDRHRWVPDATGLLIRLGIETARARRKVAGEIGDLRESDAAFKWAKSSESIGKIEAMLKIARALPPIADNGEGWDANPMLLGCENGIVNLATGELRDGRHDDRITRSTRLMFDPDAKAPRWEQFIREVFPDTDLREYVSRAIGYSLTGVTREQVWFLCHGSGSNGKGVTLDTMRWAIGEYGHVMAMSTIEKGKEQSIPADMAALAGRRLVTVSESGEYARVNEERVKGLTGEDAVTARELYKPQFTFQPELKLWLAVNTRPRVDDDSEGYWRRVRMVPFLESFPVERRDPELRQKMKEELPGVLAWMVRQAVTWRKHGLGTIPGVVAVATVAYREESDPLSGFIRECCVVAPNAKAGASALYQAYADWYTAVGWSMGDRMSGTIFGRKFSERFKKAKSGGHLQYVGVGLLADGWGENDAKPSPIGEGLEPKGGFFPKSSLGDTSRGSDFSEKPPKPSLPSPTESPAVCGCDGCPQPTDAVTDCDGQAFIASADGWHCHKCHTAIGISEEQ